MAFKDLTPAQRITAVQADMMFDADFCVLGSVSQIGEVIIDPAIPTAGATATRVRYNPDFVMTMNRKQLRYLVAHEQAHRMLRHTLEYNAVAAKYPQYFPLAIDYVVNWIIESMDTTGNFLERPTSIPP